MSPGRAVTPVFSRPATPLSERISPLKSSWSFREPRQRVFQTGPASIWNCRFFVIAKNLSQSLARNASMCVNNGSTFDLSHGDVFLSNIWGNEQNVTTNYTCYWRLTMPEPSLFILQYQDFEQSSDSESVDLTLLVDGEPQHYSR